jgi:uncharacterized protein (TIRG00374 family)
LWLRLWRALFRWQTLVWLVALALVWWVLREVPWADVLALLRGLTGLQLGLLVLVNLLYVFVVGSRSWVLLRAGGQHVPLRDTTAYWLAGFAFSFFTPGPQLSGAPLQVYLLQRDHPVDPAAATAAFAVSKLLEGAVNAGLLIFSVFAILNLGFFPQAAAPTVAGMALFLFALVGGYLLLTWCGSQPAAWLLERLPGRMRGWVRRSGFLLMLTEAERQVGAFFHQQPLALAIGILVSLLATILVILQAWLALFFLGVQLTVLEIISLLVSVQIAVLFPSPAGIGALEAAMIFVFQRLGYPSGQAIAFTLLLRLRDVLIGAAGLLSGGWSFVRGQESIQPQAMPAEPPE